MAERKLWPALTVRATRLGPVPDADLISAVIDDHSPTAIQDLTDHPLPPGGLWDPTSPPPREAPDPPLHWRIFFSSAADRDRAAAALRTARHELDISCDEVADDDWAARSQREISAVSAGPFVVAPPWDVPAPLPAGSTLVIIEPSRGFGTGHHASTRLCLRALGDIEVRGARVLDLGTGSGVLAMAASLRGARAVTAIDIDPDALEAARQSAALNPGVENVEWLVGDFRDQSRPLPGPWDVVLANLTGGMLRSAADRLRALSASGLLIASGFDSHERPDVQEALRMAVRAAYVEAGWIGLALSQPGAADSWRGARSSLRSGDASL